MLNEVVTPLSKIPYKIATGVPLTDEEFAEGVKFLCGEPLSKKAKAVLDGNLSPEQKLILMTLAPVKGEFFLENHPRVIDSEDEIE